MSHRFALGRRRLLSTGLLLPLLGSLPPAVQAHDARVGSLRLAHPYARPTPGGLRTGAVYLKAIHNNGEQDDELLGGSTPRAESVEIHAMRLNQDRMQMRQVERLVVPAQGSVRLRDGEAGHHLMLIGLKQPLRAGERFPLTLRFARAGSVQVEVWVEAAEGAAPADPHAGHAGH